MTMLIGCLAAVYAASRISLGIVGIHPVIPASFLAAIWLVFLPCALAMAWTTAFLDKRLATRRLSRAAGCALGLFFLSPIRLGGELFAAFSLAMLATGAVWAAKNKASLPRLCLAIFALFLGYAGIWNMNYAILATAMGRLHDPALRQIDLMVFNWGKPSPGAYAGFFPLVNSPFLFGVLERAYLLAFPEVLLAALLLRGRALTRFLWVLFGCYWLGLVVFALYPTVGPFTYFPESFRREWQDTATSALMQSILAEFRAVSASQPVNGFGYFVAIPSLHAALAVVLQASWRHRPVHFWSFLPVNLAMCASTVMLGYHYLIDLPAGIAVAGLVLGVDRLIARRSNAAASGPSPQPRVVDADAACFTDPENTAVPRPERRCESSLTLGRRRSISVL
jgi:hypothetical protein